ncbi:hypothetical protein [Shinella sp. BYT-45]|uniref:hypothetical protein n=1 Tax=Shinella sp. BYT-45 TaxID=3377377 RepID=UPI00397FF31E
MSTARKQPVEHTDANEKLQERYKPLGLRAVVAATQCKPEKKAADTRRKRDIPAQKRES